MAAHGGAYFGWGFEGLRDLVVIFIIDALEVDRIQGFSIEETGFELVLCRKRLASLYTFIELSWQSWSVALPSLIRIFLGISATVSEIPCLAPA